MKALREWIRAAEAIRETCLNLSEFDILIDHQKRRLLAVKGGVTGNLLLDTWSDLDQAELRIVLQERIPGGRGQYDGGLDVLYLPLAREQCRVALTYKEDQIVAIERLPAEPKKR